ncbi:MAG: acyl-CoA dehydrogenase family protein, partial [Myxococcota bacterium]|nr:acyl-CoA dehydrogenase family protein [Myxococcota bacterium]
MDNPSNPVAALAERTGASTLRCEEALAAAGGDSSDAVGVLERDYLGQTYGLLTEEQEMLQEAVRGWAEDRVAPIADAIDKEHRYPAELVQEMAEMGLLGITVPEAYGGGGMDQLSYIIAMEEVSRACASTGVIMSVNNSLVCDPLKRYGTDAQKEKWLKPLAEGKKLGCFALSEPGTGSDAAAQTCMAVRDGDDWVITGTKNWITNGPQADTCILLAMADRSLGTRGIVAFVVDMHRDGVSSGQPEEKLGICASGTSSLMFDGYRASDDERLGEVGDGFKVAMTTLDGGRIGIAAQALGIARAAMEKAIAYSGERKAFGGPISGLQAIQHKLADMATELQAARLLTWRAAVRKELGLPYGTQSAMAKLYASEAASRIVNQALQVFGGYG